MSLNFNDKVVIVTGGNSGIGLATATQFLSAGAKVAVFDVRPASDTAVNEKRMEIVCDVSIEESAEAAVTQVLDKWGTIDILCNVAGIMDAMARVSDVQTADWERVFRVNVNGPLFLMRACTKYWLNKPKADPVTTRGSIVNVCSTASKSGAHAGAAYTASKHALLGLVRSTAWVYAKEGIRCNAVLPGGVMTNIVKNSGYEKELSTAQGMDPVWAVQGLMPGLAKAEDVARAILFLAGNESANGTELTVDCGWTAM